MDFVNFYLRSFATIDFAIYTNSIMLRRNIKAVTNFRNWISEVNKYKNN
jgi:hypothetical protein